MTADQLVGALRKWGVKYREYPGWRTRGRPGGIEDARADDPPHRQQLTERGLPAATQYEKLYVSGGRRGLDITLAPADLLTITATRTAPIAR